MNQPFLWLPNLEGRGFGALCFVYSELNQPQAQPSVRLVLTGSSQIGTMVLWFKILSNIPRKAFLKGVPQYGWPDTIAYLTLPVILIASQLVQPALMSTNCPWQPSDSFYSGKPKTTGQQRTVWSTAVVDQILAHSFWSTIPFTGSIPFDNLSTLPRIFLYQRAERTGDLLGHKQPHHNGHEHWSQG